MVGAWQGGVCGRGGLHGQGGCAWQVGHAWAGGMHGRGVCVVGGMHGRGACVAGVCMAGGLCMPCMPPRHYEIRFVNARAVSILLVSGYHADTPITIKAEAIRKADSRSH